MKKQKVKVLFLDFDGVLNRWNDNVGILSLNLVNNLNTLMDTVPDLRIVVTSCWRMGRSLAGLKDVLTDFGFKHPKSVIGMTNFSWADVDEDGWTSKKRGIEVKEWLDSDGKWRFDVIDFVIVDDMDDMAPFMKKFIQTDGNVGLSMDIVNKIVRKLGK